MKNEVKYVVRKIFPNPWESNTQTVCYEELMELIPKLISCGIQNAPNQFSSRDLLHVSVNGQRLTAADLEQMRNEYLSFHTEIQHEEHEEYEVGRGFPIPSTGKARYIDDRYEFRSKMVLRDGEQMIAFRSDRKDQSWKKNTKARKSWGKHMNPGDLSLRHKREFEKFLADQDRLFMETWYPERCPWLYGLDDYLEEEDEFYSDIDPEPQVFCEEAFEEQIY